MKRIVVCCDGTWEEAEAPTNVARIARMLAPADECGVQQLVLYQEGAAEGHGGGRRGMGRLLPHCIQEGYRFIASHHQPGDEIWLFGFSRGAYTARSIVGMIRNSGLLRQEHLDKVALAYELYRNRFPETHPDSGYAEGFRDAFSVRATVKFLGAWDTVGRRGVPDSVLMTFPSHSWSFHDLQLSSIVENAYHAVALDERRCDYRACLWRCGPATRGEQVLFPGVHGDVGGGYPETGLSDCALAWMVCKARSCGLAFCPDGTAVAPDPAGVLHGPPEWKGTVPLFQGTVPLSDHNPEREDLADCCEAVSFSAQERKGAGGYRAQTWPARPALQQCQNRECCANYFRCY